jgi:uncharacterized protein YceK
MRIILLMTVLLSGCVKIEHKNNAQLATEEHYFKKNGN